MTSLPNTIDDIVSICEAEVSKRVTQGGYLHERSRVHDITHAVLEAAGIKIADDGKTLIYPSTSGTNAHRYQPPVQRNVRSYGRRRR